VTIKSVSRGDKMISRRDMNRLGLAGLGAICLRPTSGLAQTVPGTARIFVGFPSGAGADTLARRLADQLRGAFAPNIIVENKVGAGGRIAVSALKSAAPDGMTMLLTPASTMVIFPHIYKDLGYSPTKDFSPVVTVSTVKLGLMVGPGAQVNSLSDYLRWVKVDPKRAVYATPGSGTMPHFLGSMLATATKIDLQHVPYKGAGPARMDLLAGQVPAYLGIIGNDAILDHRAGRIKILALADTVRADILPDVPTFAEQGLKDATAQEWLGLFLPARTPPAVVGALSEQVRAAIKNEDMAKLLSSYAMTPGGDDPMTFTKRIETELSQWGAVIKSTGFTPQD
jgi:tripartite-type tricarboxylate transporter receptor subunit TctC